MRSAAVLNLLVVKELRDSLKRACKEERVVTLCFKEGESFPVHVVAVHWVTADVVFLDDDEETWASSGRVAITELTTVVTDHEERLRKRLAEQNPDLADQVGEEPLPTRPGATRIIYTSEPFDEDDFDGDDLDFDED